MKETFNLVERERRKVSSTRRTKEICAPAVTTFQRTRIRHRCAALIVCLWATPARSLDVTLSVRVEGGDSPIVVGTTNLPDDISLMLSLARKESAYGATEKVLVTGGTFRAGPFTQGGAGLNPGQYTIELIMPLAALQPPKTWPIIGNGGAKLRGRLVKRDIVGGKTVEYTTKYRVGIGKADPQRDKTARAEQRAAKHDWWLRSCTDVCKMTQGIARQRSEKFDWDRCYYECVADEPAPK